MMSQTTSVVKQSHKHGNFLTLVALLGKLHNIIKAFYFHDLEKHSDEVNVYC